MKINKKIFCYELQKLAENNPSWKDKMLGLLHASSYKQKPMIPMSHPELMAKQLGNMIAGTIAGGILGTSATIATGILTNKKIPTDKLIKTILLPTINAGALAGTYKGSKDFYKKRNINLNAIINPSFSEEARKKYIY
jgi:hypothetical protein